MSFSDPKVWQDGFNAVLIAPHVVAPTLALFAGAAWWLRGAIDNGAHNELRARAMALEERLTLAHDKEFAIREKLEQVEMQLDVISSSKTKKSRFQQKDEMSELVETVSEIMLVSDELSRLLNGRESQDH